MEVPKRMRHLPVYKGLPVPFVQFRVGDDPDFKVIDEGRKLRCLLNRLCGICGQKIPHDEVLALIGGDKCVDTRIFTDPPMHKECARYAAATCPYLNNALAGYSTADPKHLADGAIVREYELVNTSRPKRMAIYFTKTYKFGHIRGQGPMIYIQAGEPTSIDWDAMPPAAQEGQIVALVNRLREGEGFNLVTRPNGHDFDAVWFKSADLKPLDDDESKFHVICTSSRPGTDAFIRTLELKHFTPDTPLNDEFGYRHFRWTDMIWLIVSIPFGKRQLCYEVASETKMRIADGVPHIIAADLKGPDVKTIAGIPMKCFPMTSRRAFSLENAVDSPLYQGAGGIQDVKIESRFKVKQAEKDIP